MKYIKTVYAFAAWDWSTFDGFLCASRGFSATSELLLRTRHSFIWRRTLL